MPKTFLCQVITPEGPLLRRRVTSATFPAEDGQYGVLPGHAPMMSLVGRGALALQEGEEATAFLEMEGGFAEVRQGVLTILAERTGRLIKRKADGADNESGRPPPLSP